MRTKHADLGLYAVIAAAGGVVIQQNTLLPEAAGGDVGAAFFPSSIAVIMIVLCAIGAALTLLRENREVLSFPGWKKIVVTIAAMVVYFTLWQQFGEFYLLSIIFLAGLTIFYGSDEKLDARFVALSIAGSAMLVGVFYVFFTYVLYTKF